MSLWTAPVVPLPTKITASCSLAWTAFLIISLQCKQYNVTLYDVSVHLCQTCIPLFQGYDKNPLHILTLIQANKKISVFQGNGSEIFR